MSSRFLLPPIFALLVLAGCVGANDGQTSAPITEYVVELDPEALSRAIEDGDEAGALLEQVVPQIRRRLESADMPFSRVTTHGDRRLLIRVTGTDRRRLVEQVLGIPIPVELNLAREISSDADPFVSDQRYVVMPMADGTGQISVRVGNGIDGGLLLNAKTTFDQATNEPAVALTLNDQGAEELAQLTSSNVGEKLAIIVAGEVQIAPEILEPILDGELLISRGFTQEEANELAIRIRAGALPTSFRIVDERAVN